MRLLFITTPIRPEPTDFPPVGVLSLLKYVRNHSQHEIELYDIDCFRPDFDQAVQHIVDQKPDVLGISAVVSTAYAYVKRISLAVKQRCPDMKIVLGGNLAASAEILLKKTGVDICVTGEGEVTLTNLLNELEEGKQVHQLENVPGIVYLDENDQLINTGYEVQLPGDQLYDIDYADMEKYSKPSQYVFPAFSAGKSLVWSAGALDARTYESHRRDKNVATLSVGKGCVAKCTFCHRWDKGIRHIPVDTFIARMEDLIERYNVGFIDIHIESFGSDKRWLDEFCEKIKPYDILWRANGVRARSVTPAILEQVKDCGCVSFIYGFETGSEEMLAIMEKKLPLKSNFDAAEWTLGADLFTVAQFVIGMPGETNSTIKETTEFAKFVYTRVPWLKPSYVSINYVQALPGTPVYEYGRAMGYIGQSVDDEEQYLLLVSDKNASDESVAYNFTNAPMIDWMSWRARIVNEVNKAYIKKFGLNQFISVLNGGEAFAKKGGQVWIKQENITKLSSSKLMKEKIRFMFTGLPRILVYTTPVLRVFPSFVHALLQRDSMSAQKVKELNGIADAGLLRYAWFLAKEYLTSKLEKQPKQRSIKSLRKVMSDDIPAMQNDSAQMQPLRNGR